MKKHLLFSALVLGVIFLNASVQGAAIGNIPNTRPFSCWVGSNPSNFPLSLPCDPVSCGNDGGYIDNRNLYIPDGTWDIKYFNIVFHVALRDDTTPCDCEGLEGSTNLSAKIPTAQDFETVIKQVNEDFSGLTAYNAGQGSYGEFDTKIQFCYTVKYVNSIASCADAGTLSTISPPIANSINVYITDLPEPFSGFASPGSNVIYDGSR